MDSMPPQAPQLDVLVVGASGPDLRGFRNALGERLDGYVRGLHVCGKLVGLGMAVAGPSTAKRVFQLWPRAVIHVGTCGIYPGQDGYRPYDVLVAGRHRLVDHAVLAGRAAFPEPLQTEMATDPMLCSGLGMSGPRVFTGQLATTLAETIDDTLAASILGTTGSQAENREAFAIGHACALAQIPFTSVLGVTHIVGARGRDDWRQFERQATIAAAEVVITWLTNGAPGLRHG
jgi:nucleoside phosphorylase